MSATTVTSTTPLSTNAPVIPGYTVSQDQVDQLFEAARNGDVNLVISLATKFGLDWFSYDIDRLNRISKWYGPLESNGDSLINLLQGHKGGKFEINADMRSFLEEARLQMNAAQKDTPSGVNSTINKLFNGEDISEEEAKNLYKWCLQAKPLVIPGDMKGEFITSVLKTLQQKYEEELLRGGRLADAFSPR